MLVERRCGRRPRRRWRGRRRPAAPGSCGSVSRITDRRACDGRSATAGSRSAAQGQPADDDRARRRRARRRASPSSSVGRHSDQARCRSAAGGRRRRRRRAASGRHRRSPWRMPAWPPMIVSGHGGHGDQRGGRPGCRAAARALTTGREQQQQQPEGQRGRGRSTRRIVCSIWRDVLGVGGDPAGRGGLQPEREHADDQQQVAIRAANAPYSAGPSSRAAIIVKPYVATFMTPIATAIELPLLSIRRRRDSLGRRHSASLDGAVSNACKEIARRVRESTTRRLEITRRVTCVGIVAPRAPGGLRVRRLEGGSGRSSGRSAPACADTGWSAGAHRWQPAHRPGERAVSTSSSSRRPARGGRRRRRGAGARPGLRPMRLAGFASVVSPSRGSATSARHVDPRHLHGQRGLRRPGGRALRRRRRRRPVGRLPLWSTLLGAAAIASAPTSPR